MAKPLSTAILQLEESFTALLRACVVQQEHGEPVNEMWTRVFGQSGAHAMAQAAHEERLRMIQEGIPGISIPPQGTGFVIGFVPRTGDEENSIAP